MTRGSPQRETIRQRLADEVGPSFVAGSRRAAFVYPSPYRTGMSSLGFQWILTQLIDAGIAVERAFLPDPGGRPEAPLTYETLSPLSRFPLICVSLAYELELAGLIEILQLSGIPPLREDRGPEHPQILLGGPLTMSNPLPAAPFVDAMLLGEAEETAPIAAQAFFDADTHEGWLEQIRALPGGFVPADGVELPAIAKASDALLPARTRILTPHTELSSMFLLEGERGCHRQCSFCVMRRSTNGGMRLVTPERILDLIPDHARKVGLVGAAISDHPKLVPLLQTLVDSGRSIGMSSLRADRVARKPDIPRLLRQSGARTLTVASDAASQRLRKVISKGTLEKHVLACAHAVREHGFEVLKVYMMLGLPGENEEDVEELIRFTLELSKICRVALGVAPFVAKKNTPLDATEFAGIKVVERRLKQLSRGLKGRAEVRPTSAKWAWVEYQLAQGGPEAGLAVLDAVNAGGRFANYKRAFEAVQPESLRPWIAA